jgi:hypothetical protein
MKKLILFLTLALLASCSQWSSNSRVYSSKISRSAASDVSDLTAVQRLQMIVKHIEALKETISPDGNPKYYLLENFLNRTEDLVDQMVSSQNTAMLEYTYIPQNMQIASYFNRFVSAYNVFESSLAFLEETQQGFLPEESEEVQANFSEFKSAMKNYQDALDGIFSAGVFEESVREKVQAREQRELLHYLASRIEMYYEEFKYSKRSRANRRKKSRVKWLVNSVYNITAKTPSVFKNKVRGVVKRRKWRRAHKILSKIDLPDSQDINGADHAFEMVMSVQMSSELLQHLTKMVLN